MSKCLLVVYTLETYTYFMEENQTLSMFKNKKFSKIFILLVVLILFVVGYGILAKNYHYLPHITSNPNQSMSAIDITGWQTYRNEKYKIEFNYPNELSPSENEDTGGDSERTFLSIDFQKQGSTIFSVLTVSTRGIGHSAPAISKVVTLNNQQWVMSQGGDANSLIEFDPTQYVDYWSTDNSLFFTSSYSNRILVEQILSTFKFTK